MIEVLVTLAIVATALLGTAGLQLYAMRMNQGSQFRNQAIFLVSDLAERMEANKLAAINGSYAATTPADGLPTSAATDCATAACDATSLAAWDLSIWETTVKAMLPQSQWTVTHTALGNPSTYTISVSWVDRGSDTSSHSETLSYTATRTIGE